MIRGVLLPIITPLMRKSGSTNRSCASSSTSHQCRGARSIRTRLHRTRPGHDLGGTKTDGGDCA